MSEQKTLLPHQIPREEEAPYRSQVRNEKLFVSGPVSLTEHYSKVYNKHIYILGDIHSDNETPCHDGYVRNTIALIEDMINSTDYVVDVFFESHTNERQFKLTTIDLAQTREFFRGVFKKRKTKL